MFTATASTYLLKLLGKLFITCDKERIFSPKMLIFFGDSHDDQFVDN